jgi:hypothetical protein
MYLLGVCAVVELVLFAIQMSPDPAIRRPNNAFRISKYMNSSLVESDLAKLFGSALLREMFLWLFKKLIKYAVPVIVL